MTFLGDQGKHHLRQVLTKKVPQPHRQAGTWNSSHLCLMLKFFLGSHSPGVAPQGRQPLPGPLQHVCLQGPQTETRQWAKRLSAGTSHHCQALNHWPVSPDPRDTWCIQSSRQAEEVCPFLSPYGSAQATRPCHMAAGQGTNPTSAQLPRAAQGPEVHQEMRSLPCPFSPAGPLRGKEKKKKFGVWLCKLLKASVMQLSCLGWGATRRPLSQTLPNVPSSRQLTTLHAGAQCAPRLPGAPRKLAAAAPRVQPAPAPP